MSVDDVYDWLWQAVTALQYSIAAAGENGLFAGSNEAKAAQMFKKLEEIRTNWNDLSKRASSEETFYEVKLELTNLFHSASRYWLFKYLYGGPAWIYFVGSLALVYIFYLFFVRCTTDFCHIIPSSLYYSLQTLSVPASGLYATTWGIIGAILQGLYWNWQNVSNLAYRKSWLIWAISIPFLGGIFGALVYFLLASGLLILSSGSTNIADINKINPYIIIAIAIYSGYNWQNAINWLTQIAGRFGLPGGDGR